MLFAPCNGGIETFTDQSLAQLAPDLINQMRAVAARCSSGSFQAACTHWVERFESKILKFHTHFIHTEAHRNGCVNIQCFAGNALYFFAIQHA